ncbi:hypothetical protein L6164_018254 [Bauhinia variegata]|uniref:Uncharacterized protein n=1 Tax=Bauhinia variegata TaxID=167791 RepID=A0ACB9NBM4_BAUVA|nr:hypothetical protein L6164_018254 [Bauhinia variegata]
MDSNATGSEEYLLLKDLRLEIEAQEGTFSLCFWVYIMNSTSFPATIIQQVHNDMSESAPFLLVNDKKRVNLLPVLLLHEEAPDTGNVHSWKEVPHATVDFEFGFMLDVSPDRIRLQINGEVVGERSLSSLLNKESNSCMLKKITLANVGGDGDSVQGFVHNLEVFPHVSSIKDHHSKDPPLKLSIDESSASEIEEESAGAWGIVGGKASCHWNFSLDIVLLDAFGQPVDKENEVFASLLYADTGTPVEDTTDEEAPLLVSHDGIEFAAHERPSKLLQGRASFKLKISQLSSKCDNRLFLIRFYVPKLGNYPFLQTFSHPIRCISRSRSNNAPLSTLVWKRSTSALQQQQLNLSQSLPTGDGSLEHQRSVYEVKTSPLLKQFRLGRDKISVSVNAECNSHARTSNQVDNQLATSLKGRPENIHGVDDSPSDTESTGERNSPSKNIACRRNPISDMTIFKYCLAGLAERSLMHKEISTSASDQEISEFAQQKANTNCQEIDRRRN